MTATKRALLVGIDEYPDPRNRLNSCIADTLAFRQMLLTTYGFDLNNITLLHNSAATLANVRTALDTLFAGVGAGDHIIYFESSHGYRYVDGSTMVEVLCLYDGFLHDTELVQRTKPLAPDTLTVVADACHAGGLNKLFFLPGGPVAARAKVFQPPVDDAVVNAALLQQVSSFKFFGRRPTGDVGAVAKNFAPDFPNIPLAKDVGEGELELNGALFAACMADQTAAAGSPPTGNLSAFTWAVTKEAIDKSISLSELNSRVNARLRPLNLGQTPIVEVPVAHQEVAQETFITMEPLGAADGHSEDSFAFSADKIATVVQDLQNAIT
jgi:Caspase domain